MNLKVAKNMFNDIIELCYQLNDQILNGAIDSFYQDVKNAGDEFEILEITSELMFYVDEVNISDEEVEEIKTEIEGIYNKMQDEIE